MPEESTGSEPAAPADGDLESSVPPETADIPEYMDSVADPNVLQPGDIVRRQATGKDHQGRFVRLADDGGLVVEDIIDLAKHEYLAEVGILRTGAGDRLFVHRSRFAEDAASREALEVVANWALWREHPELRGEFTQFVRGAFSPAQIRDWKKKDSLRSLFVTIQHRFRIGRHKEKTDWNKVRVERFGEALRSLFGGKHMTYVAFIPREGSSDPMFYTIGTKPHLETMKQLEREPFGFRPNNGGHIKCIDEGDGKQVLLVDAGSNDLGAGMHTPLAIAELVVEALKRLYPDFEYRPMAGRGAFGLQQSY